MALSTLVFWLIALMTVVSALVVVGARNILHAAFGLCTAFLGVGSLYVFLHADFVAAVQLIVYVGGILVLIMFAVMFSSNVVEDSSEKHRSWFSMAFGGAAALGIFAIVCMTMHRLEVPLAEQNRYAAVDYVNTVGVTTEALTPEEKTLLEKHAPLLSPTAPPELRFNTLSNDDAKARMTKELGEDEGSKLFEAWTKKDRGHYGIGHKLIGEYLLPFEVVSVLLMGALLGAVVIVRKELS